MYSVNSQNSLSQPHFLMRLWRYQAERFPLFKHSLLIASFSLCAVCLSSLLRGANEWLPLSVIGTAFVCLLLFFLQLRIADEFKDYQTDLRYRPERAVPRGLVSLAELRVVGIISALIQVVIVLLLQPPLLLFLLAVWFYMALMRYEFGLSSWLQARPTAYLLSHMGIVPLIDLFATACDWLPLRPLVAVTLPTGLHWFLLMSFFNGIVIEIGRKTWAPTQERPGVESYSAVWGIQRAVILWVGALLLSFTCAILLALQIGFLLPVVSLLSLFLLVLGWHGLRFIRQPDAKQATRLETFSGLWVASLYLILGIIPLGIQQWLR